MTNDQVIAVIKKILKEMEKRHAELVKLRKDPGGEFWEFADRQMRVLTRLSSLNMRIFHLQNRLRERELAKEIGDAVKPLTQARKKALTAALKKVSMSISQTNTFKAAIKLATDISAAATKAEEATTVV